MKYNFTDHTKTSQFIDDLSSGISEPSNTTLHKIFESYQRHFNLKAQRGLLLLLLVLQGSFFTGYLAYQRIRIEDDATHTLRNTALLEAQEFKNSVETMSYQMRVIGSAILSDRTIPIENTDLFLTQELERKWLDAVIVFNADGDFIAKGSGFPLEQTVNTSALAHDSFRDRPLFRELRRRDENERVFFWQGNSNTPNSRGFVTYRAVRNSEGDYLGGVVGYISAATMQAMFHSMIKAGFYLGRGGIISVVDCENGVPLFRIGSDITSNNARTPIRMSYTGNGAQLRHYISPIDGTARTGVFLNLSVSHWVIVVSFAEDSILRAWYLQVILIILAMTPMGILQWVLLHRARSNFLHREYLLQESQQDPLTGLPNRRYFYTWARITCNQAQSYQYPLCVLIFDLDYFKKINDNYGHNGGDAVLRSLRHVTRCALRENDIVARFGGEEFVVGLVNIELNEAYAVAERIRNGIASLNVKFNEQTIRFTASFGLAQMTADELKMNEGIQSVIARADQALYRSKQEGRNRVTVAS